jgi:Putative porin
MAIIRKIPELMLLFFFCASLHAQDADEARGELETLRQTTVKMIETMVQSGIITKEKAEELLREARREAAKSISPEKSATDKEKIIRVPYVPQMVKDNIKEEIREEVLAQAKKERWGEPGALPEWISRMKFSVEIKFRVQSNHLPDANAPVGTYVDVQGTNSGGSLTLLNTQADSQLARVQLRLDVEAPVDTWVTAGARLTTGGLSSPVSQNQTLGANFSRGPVGLDRAYIKLSPLTWTTLWLGKFANPWFSTDLVWDEDLGFEGLVLTLRKEVKTSGTTPFFTAGLLPMQGYDCTNLQILGCGEHKRLMGAQLGLDQKMSGSSHVKLAAAFYDFENVEGRTNDPAFPTDKTFVPAFVQKGNSMFNVNPLGSPQIFGLASKFREVNLTAELDLGIFDPTRIVLSADYVKNIGFDRQGILDRTGLDLEPRTKGFQIRLLVGQPAITKRSQWQTWLGYKYVERDAVMDAFNDSDFHLGGTDAKGWLIGGTLGIANNTSLRLRWFSANEIDNPPLAIDVFQMDITARF